MWQLEGRIVNQISIVKGLRAHLKLFKLSILNSPKFAIQEKEKYASFFAVEELHLSKILMTFGSYSTPGVKDQVAYKRSQNLFKQ